MEGCWHTFLKKYWNKAVDEEKERQKEIKEKLEGEGLDPDEFDEDER